MNSEPESLVLKLLRDMRVEMGGMRVELKADIQSLRGDVAAGLLAAEARTATKHKQTREQIVGLRRAVIGYQAIGHGILIGELEARPRRVEQHLDLPPLEVQ